MSRAGGLVSREEALAGLQRLARRGVQRTRAASVEVELGKLRPFVGWEENTRTLLGRRSDKAGASNPANWTDTTAVWHLKSLRIILTACDSCGLSITDYDQLLTAEVLQCLSRRAGLMGDENDLDAGSSEATAASNHPPVEGSWGLVYLGTLLRSLRTICAAAKGLELPSEFRDMIWFCSDLEHRRDVSARVLPREMYFQGAIALEAFGRLAHAVGKHAEAERARFGSQLLAIAADCSPRRSELGLAKADRVFPNPLADGPELRIYSERETSKARTFQPLRVTHPFAVQQLEERLKEAEHGLFSLPGGKPANPAAIYGRLQWASTTAMGVPTSFNILRKVAVAALSTSAARRSQLRQSEQSILADTTYHPDLLSQGRLQLSRSWDELIRRARGGAEP